MNDADVIDALLSISESMNEEEKEILERAADILTHRAGDRGVYGPFDSRVTAVGNTHYAAIGEAVKVLGLAPRDRIRITVERY